MRREVTFKEGRKKRREEKGRKEEKSEGRAGRSCEEGYQKGNSKKGGKISRHGRKEGRYLSREALWPVSSLPFSPPPLPFSFPLSLPSFLPFCIV
jgi:hypothetical protein